MFTYYVHIPDSQFPTAEVEASSTKHARTVYLDYLSRNGQISWQQRQNTRPAIKVSRMQPGEFQTQIHLEYELKEEPPVKEIEAPPADIDVGEFTETPAEFSPEELEEVKRREVSGYYEQSSPLTGVRGNTIRDEKGRPIAQPQQREPFGSSPIVELSRKSRGM